MNKSTRAIMEDVVRESFKEGIQWIAKNQTLFTTPAQVEKGIQEAINKVLGEEAAQ